VHSPNSISAISAGLTQLHPARSGQAPEKRPDDIIPDAVRPLSASESQKAPDHAHVGSVTVCGASLAGFQIGRERINEGGPLWLFHTAVFCQPGSDAEVKKQVSVRIDPSFP
jgi:hypothetical protein